MQDGGHDFPDGLHARRIEVERAERERHVFVISPVADGIHFGHASLAQEVVVRGIALQMQLRRLGVRRAKQ